MTKMLFWMAFLCLWASASIAAPEATDRATAYALQLCAYARQSGAEQAALLLKDKGIDAYVTTNQKGLYVVRAGNHGSRLEAKTEGARLKAEHTIGSFLVIATHSSEPTDTTVPPEESITAETPQAQEDPPPVIETAPPDPALIVAPAETPAPCAKDNPEEVSAKTSAKSQMVAAFGAMANQPMAPHPPGFRAAQIALDFIGVKYRWGGMSVEKGMDCSGFVKTVYALCGINLPRTSAEQYRHGQPVKSGELAVGDMVFFGTNKRVNHVGIYLGDGKIIHAPRSKDKIRISSMEEGSLRRKFLGARRLLLGE